ncbi:MAG: acyl-CoA dehydrogenase family protein [Hyphomonadaceae bacterium]
MSDLLAEQFDRLLSDLPTDEKAAQAAIEASGFLDVLVAEAKGGAGLSLAEAFDLGFAAGRRLAPGAVTHTMLARALGCANDALPKHVAAAATALEMAGAMANCVDITIEYAGMRRQFGREISKFQAIQHQLAVMAEEAMAAKMAARLAFVGAAQDLTESRAAIAKIRAGEAAQIVAAGAHAVHGAIGISQEHALHRYTKALRARRIAHGGESYWAEILGRETLAAKGGVLEFVRAL